MSIRLRALLLVVCMLLTPFVFVSAEATYTWAEGEITYPEGEDWIYRYTYRYPVLSGDAPAAHAVNAWFDVAFSEMNDLILPMFASEADMAGGGANEIDHLYAVTCNSDDFFSILLTQTQDMGERPMMSLTGQVFAMSGEYTGETLTLRGLLRVGDSSQQIAEAIVRDVWTKVKDLPGALERWEDPDHFMDDFDPETQFYADEKENAVFFLQPGVLDEMEPMTFAYSAQAAEALLKEQEKEIAP